ncbi:MAG: hypothetical protein JRN15_08555 [Nitrososphaerota archaeon]|nr:hypothetical protein [Nitrososphaerota archaeon]
MTLVIPHNFVQIGKTTLSYLNYDLRRSLSFPHGSVEVGVEAHQDEIMLNGSHILIGVIKVEIEFHSCANYFSYSSGSSLNSVTAPSIKKSSTNLRNSSAQP